MTTPGFDLGSSHKKTTTLRLVRAGASWSCRFVQGRVEGKGGAWYALHYTAKAIAESVGAFVPPSARESRTPCPSPTRATRRVVPPSPTRATRRYLRMSISSKLDDCYVLLLWPSDADEARKKSWIRSPVRPAILFVGLICVLSGFFGLLFATKTLWLDKIEVEPNATATTSKPFQ